MTGKHAQPWEHGWPPCNCGRHDTMLQHNMDALRDEAMMSSFPRFIKFDPATFKA